MICHICFGSQYISDDLQLTFLACLYAMLNDKSRSRVCRGASLQLFSLNLFFFLEKTRVMVFMLGNMVNVAKQC